MLYSKIFTKTNKSAKEYDSINATLLIKAGFIEQVMAGVYTFLPLGLRVLNKIENIIREEMDKIGVELLMSSLAPKEIWEKANRLKTIDILFKAEGANELSKALNDATYVLNATHEDNITPIAKKFNTSYKDLPFAVYQIQTKFRNEPRPKSGLLRTREFRMKDLYSFHKDENDLLRFYEVAKKAYFEVYEKLGIRADTYYCAASGGDFTEEFSHEFQTKCETGEDTIFYCKTDDIAYNKEVAPSMAPEPKSKEKGVLELKEVFGENIVGVKDLAKFLNIPEEKTTKTLIYESDQGIIVASVRGDYDINEEKLKKTAGTKSLNLAAEQTVRDFTGAEIGYAGIINLPEDKKYQIYIDESVKYLTNFETGANKTNYHVTNINWNRDLPMPEVFYDIKTAKEGDLHPDCGEKYEVFSASEVGNIFPLNTKFSEAFDYYYTDENGDKKIIYMGSYGIGSSRVMGVIVEKFHDSKGIVWPENIAPYQVHLIGLNLEDKKTKTAVDSVYKKLEESGIEVLYDDRTEASAGEKFSDADLVGIPHRIVISQKTGSKIEYKNRIEEKAKIISMEDLLKILKVS